VATYRIKDLNRYRKVYPYIRAMPRYVYEYDNIQGDAQVEAGKVTFTDADSGIYTFTSTYSAIPSVVISTVNSTSSNDTNVSITVTSISTVSATITASAPFTGEVHIHVAAV
jgi:hypothetical protein